MKPDRDTLRHHAAIDRVIRAAWNARGMRIIIVPRRASGASAWIDWRAWHYETMGGAIIHHPSAYAKRGWSNMRYISSKRGIYLTERVYQHMHALDLRHAQMYLEYIIDQGGRLSFGGD